MDRLAPYGFFDFLSDKVGDKVPYYGFVRKPRSCGLMIGYSNARPVGVTGKPCQQRSTQWECRWFFR